MDIAHIVRNHRTRASIERDSEPTIRELIAKCHALSELIADDTTIHDNYGSRY